jgi:hypothetical protein
MGRFVAVVAYQLSSIVGTASRYAVAIRRVNRAMNQAEAPVGIGNPKPPLFILVEKPFQSSQD